MHSVVANMKFETVNMKFETVIAAGTNGTTDNTNCTVKKVDLIAVIIRWHIVQFSGLAINVGTSFSDDLKSERQSRQIMHLQKKFFEIFDLLDNNYNGTSFYGG